MQVDLNRDFPSYFELQKDKQSLQKVSQNRQPETQVRNVNTKYVREFYKEAFNDDLRRLESSSFPIGNGAFASLLAASMLVSDWKCSSTCKKLMIAVFQFCRPWWIGSLKIHLFLAWIFMMEPLLHVILLMIFTFPLMRNNQGRIHLLFDSWNWLFFNYSKLT